jgi:hypothetical protein
MSYVNYKYLTSNTYKNKNTLVLNTKSAIILMHFVNLALDFDNGTNAKEMKSSILVHDIN